MFEHLLSIDVEEFDPAASLSIDKATPAQVLDAQYATANLFADMGVPSDEEIDERIERQKAREIFVDMVSNPTPDDDAQKLALTSIKAPESIQRIVGMLTGFDWEFVEKAKEIRGYVVTKLLEETENRDPKIRLRALQMLGNVTEVKLFTERVEVKKIDATEEELNAQVQAKLKAFLDRTVVADTPAAEK